MLCRGYLLDDDEASLEKSFCIANPHGALPLCVEVNEITFMVQVLGLYQIGKGICFLVILHFGIDGLPGFIRLGEGTQLPKADAQIGDPDF